MQIDVRTTRDQGRVVVSPVSKNRYLVYKEEGDSRTAIYFTEDELARIAQKSEMLLAVALRQKLGGYNEHPFEPAEEPPRWTTVRVRYETKKEIEKRAREKGLSQAELLARAVSAYVGY